MAFTNFLGHPTSTAIRLNSTAQRGPSWALEDGSTFQSWAAFLATASEHESGKPSRAPCKLIRVEGNGSVKNSWNRNFWVGFGFFGRFLLEKS